MVIQSSDRPNSGRAKNIASEGEAAAAFNIINTSEEELDPGNKKQLKPAADGAPPNHRKSQRPQNSLIAVSPKQP